MRSNRASLFGAPCTIRTEDRVLVAAHGEQLAVAGRVLIVPLMTDCAAWGGPAVTAVSHGGTQKPRGVLARVSDAHVR